MIRKARLDQGAHRALGAAVRLGDGVENAAFTLVLAGQSGLRTGERDVTRRIRQRTGEIRKLVPVVDRHPMPFATRFGVSPAIDQRRPAHALPVIKG